MLKEIAATQTEIQYKLKTGLNLMRKWREGHNGYFEHLESVLNLPEVV